MKINAALAKSLLMVAASIGLAMPMLAKPPAKPIPDAAKQEGTAKPAGEEPEATIQGTVVPRKDGSFLGISIVDGGFKLAFYDAKKKQIDCPVASAAASWKPHNIINAERRVLNPSGDGKTLVSPAVRPPYNFKLFLTLLAADGQVVESFSNIDFLQ